MKMRVQVCEQPQLLRAFPFFVVRMSISPPSTLEAVPELPIPTSRGNADAGIQTIMKPLDFSGRTRVLAEKSIWAAGTEAESKVDWPTRDELKYEGEQQARQGRKRRLPLPKEHKLKGIDRSEMVNAGQEDQVKKMERGEMSMPWRMKEIAKVVKFDDTKLGLQDRVNKGLEKPEKTDGHVQWVEEETVFQNGWLGNDLLNEL